MPNKAETFARSETHINLMRAFAGESQARNRYTIAAGMAREKNLYVVQQAFLFTADQELTHAKQFYRQLADLSGQTVRADGTYPVDLYPDLLSHLRAAQHNEFQEWEHDYAHFAKTASEEGFPLVAKLFDSIAGIERIHGERFGRFADLLEREELFVSSVTWSVDVSELRLCGGVHHGPCQLPRVPPPSGLFRAHGDGALPLIPQTKTGAALLESRRAAPLLGRSLQYMLQRSVKVIDSLRH